MKGDTQLKYIGFSSRAQSAFDRKLIYTIDELTDLSTSEVRDIRNIGKGTYNEIINVVHSLKLLFADEKWKDPSLEKKVLEVPIEAIGLSKKAVTFLKKQNGIYNIFDFIQIEDNFLSLESLSGSLSLSQTIKREIIEKRKEAEFISLSTYKDKIEKEIGPLYILGGSLDSLLPNRICKVITETSNIKTIRELLQLSNDYSFFQRFRDLEKRIYISIEMFEQIVSIIHDNNLFFADERIRMRLKKEHSKEELRALSLEEIMLPVHDVMNLNEEKINTVEDLCNLSLNPSTPMKCIYGIGKIGKRTTIVDKLHELGLHFKDEESKDDKIEESTPLHNETIELEEKNEEKKKAIENYEFLLQKYNKLKEEEKKLNEEIEKALQTLSSIHEGEKTYVKK